MGKAICSFIEFWEEISSFPDTDDEIFIYRGQSDADYMLEPSIFRDRQKNKNAEQEAYREILVEYPEKFNERGHLSTLARMQHYGTHTRLLDFSLNPLVALYMAVEQNPKANGQVYVCRIKKNELLYQNSDKAMMLACLPLFSRDEQENIKSLCKEPSEKLTATDEERNSILHRFLHEIRSERPSFPCEIVKKDLLRNYFVRADKDNERMKAQNGLFLIFGLGYENAEDSDLKYNCIEIDSGSKSAILKDLRKMGISSSTMYPGEERRAMDLAKKRVEWVSIDK